MNDEDEEFNRIEREASMRKEAVRATVAQQEPIKWMEMVVANLVREGVNKHKARELAQHFYTSPPAQGDKFKSAYIEAMVASNEAGFSGMTAADTIRELSRMVSEQPVQEPIATLDEIFLDFIKKDTP
jgi:hypothetical protein